MTTPCDKGPVIDRVLDHLESHGEKLDKISDHLTVLAVQKERIDRLDTQGKDHEGRIRTIESAPVKRLERAAWLILGGIGSVFLLVAGRML